MLTAGIVGLPNVGKSTLFNAVTRTRKAEAANYPFCTIEPNQGMVTVPDELTRSAALLDACVAELEAQGIACRRPPLGIMVEVPAVAVMPELFRKAAFFSIGSNDLTQYVTASSRDDARVAVLNDPANPAVTALIAKVARFGHEAGIPVSLCGDMASEPRHLAALLDAGLTSLSVAPARIARLKAAIAEL